MDAGEHQRYIGAVLDRPPRLSALRSNPPRNPTIGASLGPVRGALSALAEGSGRSLLVACSGGADSVATLGLLVLLERSEGLTLSVGHVDHGLRPESADEAELVRALAEGLGLPCFVERVELARGPGLPARARAARRGALEAMARQAGADAIVLAHTATDQAETMLMHATRGAGLVGLAAMPVLDGPWLRPVLDLTRMQTRELAELLDLPFVDDPSNEDREQLRTWLRHEVLRPLRATNPRVEVLMAGLAQEARDAQEAVEVWAMREVDSRRTSLEGGAESWTLDEFDALPRAIRMRVMRRLCELAGADLSRLHRRTVAAMEQACVDVSEATRAGRGAPRPAPRRWQLHPGREVIVDKNGVRYQSTAGLGSDDAR